ncbi:hypothetical protein IGI04_022964, partial [Brassica rapa subsp. trilocularis]
MKKKKPKKSPPAKAKSLGSPPIENSPPPSSSPPPSHDEGSLLPAFDEFVSDAHLGFPAAVAAQQTRDEADLSPPVEPFSAKKVIVEESTDPSPERTVTLNTQVELSSEAMSGSSSDSRPVGSVVNVITVAAEPKGILANADAKDVGRKTRRSRSRNKQKWVVVDPQKASITPFSEQAPEGQIPPIIHTKTSLEVITLQSKLGTEKDTVRGEPSGTTGGTPSKFPRSVSANSRSSQPELQADSSDVDSSDSELEE